MNRFVFVLLTGLAPLAYAADISAGNTEMSADVTLTGPEARQRMLVQRVEDGSRLVNESGGTLEGIVESIKRVSGIIEEVASASRQQTGSIGQLNQAVHQIEEGTQQNAALVEEIAAASKSLEEQADKMVGLVDYFRTGETVAAARRPSARAA